METVKACIDVVALAGLEGHTLQEFWAEVSISCPSYQLDSHSKEFIWKQLLQQSCSPSPTLSLYRLPTPRVVKVLDDVYNHPFPYKFVSEDEVRGSCACYSEREDVTLMVVDLVMNLHQVQEKFGDHLVLVASQELRERALYPPHMESPIALLSDIQYAILEVVGRARYLGVTRPFFGNEYLGIDIRSVFHHVKILRLSGLVHIQIQHKCDSKYKTAVTHMIYLKRFASIHEVDPLVHSLKKDICLLLERAPYRALSCISLAQVLKVPVKVMRRACLSLSNGGLIEEVNMSAISAEMKHKGYRLVKPYHKEEEEEEEEEEEGGGGGGGGG